MPHKHKRKHGVAFGSNEKEDFDLPPETKARPLSVLKTKHITFQGFDDDDTKDKSTKKRKASSEERKKQRKKERAGRVVDDTPKQFARLMRWTQEGKALRKGEDDGTCTQKKSRSKGQKQNGGTSKASSNGTNIQRRSDSTHENNINGPKPHTITTSPAAATNPAQYEKLQIQPHEPLSTFSRRVDQSIPLSSSSSFKPSSTTDPSSTKAIDKKLGLKQHLTKHNKRLLRIQTEWRNTEAKLRAKEAEEREEMEDKLEEEGLVWADVEGERGRRKGKKRKVGSEGDVWAVLERKRKEEGRKRTMGLGVKDVVQQPPVLRLVKNMFKTRDSEMRFGRS